MRTLLYKQSNVEIVWDAQGQWLHVRWSGSQSLNELSRDCEQISRLLIAKRTGTVLIDGSSLVSFGVGAVDWMAREWIPQAKASGLQHLAWVYGEDQTIRTAVQKITAASSPGSAKAFDNPLDAAQWLRVERHRAKTRTQRVVLPPELRGH